MLNWEEEVAPALAKVGLAPQPAVQPQKAPQPDQVAIAPQAAALRQFRPLIYRVAQPCVSMPLISA